jgi:galactonate dehydratase
METCLIKITTDNGITGWGEAQAPILLEIAGSVIRYLLGPFLIGKNPLQHEKIYHQMVHMMEVRGHANSFFITSLRLSISLYGISKASITRLLYLNCREDLRHKAAARARFESGCPNGQEHTGSCGSGCRIVCRYIMEVLAAGSHKAGKAAAGTESWLYAPLPPNDLKSHSILLRRSEIPIAVGEQFRAVHEIAPWMDGDALHIVQPDVSRCGITTMMRISELARTHYKKVAPHLGISSSIGTAATWQVAASLPHFLIQEFQLDMFEEQQKLLEKPLQVERGKLIVPQKK